MPRMHRSLEKEIFTNKQQTRLQTAFFNLKTYNDFAAHAKMWFRWPLKQSRAFPKLIFAELTCAPQHYVRITGIDRHENRTLMWKVRDADR
jgi:hypothetical protein